MVTDPREREKISKMSPYAGPAREAGVLIIPCMNCEKVRLDKQGEQLVGGRSGSLLTDSAAGGKGRGAGRCLAGILSG